MAARLFEFLGVPKRERTSKLEELMGWSYHPAHRRLKGEVPWTVDELEQLAHQCGMTLGELLQIEHEDESVPAMFSVGALRVPCRAWLVGPSDPERLGAVVATQEGGEWLIVATTDARDLPSFVVKSVLLLPVARGPRRRVAVVDDSVDITDGVCDYLRDCDFDAQPFASFEQLSEALKTQVFDAFVIDWLVGAASAARLIAEIRGIDPQCPIAVLTGKVREGQADQNEVAAAVTRYKTFFYEKPAPAAIIAATLKQALELLPPKSP